MDTTSKDERDARIERDVKEREANIAQINREKWAESCRRVIRRVMIKTYKQSSEDADAFLERHSNFVCDSCGDPLNHRKEIHLDHDHKTGMMRGWLCRFCNSMLGFGKDSPERLELGAAYLKRNKSDKS